MRAAKFDGDQSLPGGRGVVAAGRAVGQELVQTSSLGGRGRQLVQMGQVSKYNLIKKYLFC